MSARKTSSRRKAGQRNAQRGASHVGSGDVVGGGPSPASLYRLAKEWTKEGNWFHRIGAKMCREMNMAGKEYMQTGAAYRLCSKDLLLLMERAKKRQPAPNRSG